MDCSSRPGKGISYAEVAEAWAKQWPVELRDFAFGKCLLALLERFPIDSRETDRDRRIERLSEQISRLTAQIVDRSLNSAGPAKDIAALIEKRDRVEAARQRLLRGSQPSDSSGSWVEFLRLDGDGEAISEPIELPSKAVEWRTCWEYGGLGYFGLYLLSSPHSGAIEFIGDNFGNHGPARDCYRVNAPVTGRYFMEVDQGQGPWEVWIEFRR